MRSQWLGSCILVWLVGCGGGAATDAAAPGAAPGGARDAGYFRAQLSAGYVPEADSITVEGFVGEHSLPPVSVACASPLCVSGQVASDRELATGADKALVLLSLASNIDIESRPRLPLNLAAVVDVSGSMSEDDRLGYVQEGLLLMLDSLTAEDRLALVTYSSSAQVVVSSRYVTDKEVFRDAIYNLAASGSTNLNAGMVAGYDELVGAAQDGVLSRLMLLSDGLANTGITDADTILATSAGYGEQGIGITTIGVGLEFNETLMRELAEQAGGNFYFLQDATKIATVFRDELDFLLTPIANDLDMTLAFGSGFTFERTYGLAYSLDADNVAHVHVPTVFASKRNGAIFLQLSPLGLPADHSGEGVVSLAYSYRPLDADGAVLASESAAVDAVFPDVEVLGTRAYEDPRVHKAVVLWNMATTFQEAARLYHESYDAGAALELIESLASYVDDANLVLEDEELRKDRAELINQFAVNFGGYLGEPYYEDEEGHCIDYCGDAPHPYMYACNAGGQASLPALFALAGLVWRRRRKD